MACMDCLYFKRCVVLGVELDIQHNKEADKNCRHFINKADFVNVWKIKEKIIDLYNDKAVLKMNKVDRLNFRKGLVAVDKMLSELVGGKTE
ncbi:MAG: hypothetical protein IJM94_06680 [Clostridia bacterium]|nr:hypothetical protein [Clostridia bacterium]